MFKNVQSFEPKVAVFQIFGEVGSTFAIFSSTYEIPLCLASIAILGITYIAMVKGISTDCKIKINKEFN